MKLFPCVEKTYIRNTIYNKQASRLSNTKQILKASGDVFFLFCLLLPAVEIPSE